MPTARAADMTPARIAAYVDAAAAALDLPLAPAHRPGVIQYFALAASMAELVNAHPLQLADEPAAVFTPVSPPAAAFVPVSQAEAPSPAAAGMSAAAIEP